LGLGKCRLVYVLPLQSVRNRISFAPRGKKRDRLKFLKDTRKDTDLFTIYE